MGRATFALALTITALAACAPQAARGQALDAAPAPLRAVPQGTAVRLSALDGDPRYRATLLREFDSITPENAMKMNALQPRRGEFHFAATDRLVGFARDHGLAVRGHALVWGQALPLWLVDHGLTERLGLRLPPLIVPTPPNPLGELLGSAATALAGWRRDELLAVMGDHIRTVMRRYAADVREWDVVNEPIAADGTLAATVWRRSIGPDYVEQALRIARAADPTAKLFINEYAVEFPGPKLDGLVRLARDLVQRGVPLDGIGLQTHTHVAGARDEATMRGAMRRFADLGLEVQVTEMDVAVSPLEANRPEQLRRQALAYGAVARACNAVTACSRFTTWGFTDAVSWLSAGEAGLLFDREYRPKPAYAAVRSAFAPR